MEINKSCRYIFLIAMLIVAGLFTQNAHGRAHTKSPHYECISIGSQPGTFNVATGSGYDNLKWGIIDKTGRTLVKPQYAWPIVFVGDYAEVQLNGKWGVINKKYQYVLPCKYNSLSVFKDGIAFCKSGDVETVINLKTKKNLFSINEKKVSIRLCEYSDGLILANDNNTGNYGYLNLSGKKVIPFTFDRAEAFNEGLAGVMIDNRVAYIDKTGKKAFDPTFYLPEFDGTMEGTEISAFKSGMAVIYDNVPSEYGYNLVRTGIINKKGEIVLPIIYEWIDRDSSGKLIAYLDTDDGTGRYDIIGSNGAVLKSIDFPDVSYREYDIAGDILIERNYDEGGDTYKFTNSKGNLFSNLKITKCEPGGFENGYMLVKLGKDKRWSVMDINGKIIFRNIANYTFGDLYRI